MGEFKAGQWIIMLLVYFTLLFIIVYCVRLGFTESESAQQLVYDDPGYGAASAATNQIGSQDPAGSVSTGSPGMSNIVAALSVMTAVNSDNVHIGIPAAWHWLFSFFLFYIPFTMLLWAIYMALPILH